MSIIQGSSISASSTESGGFYEYPIEQSLRFDGTSSYLSRTPTATGNQKIWTFSAWVKRSRISTGTIQTLISSTTDGGYYDGIAQFGFSGSDTFFVYYDADTGDSSGNPNSSVFRDTSSFYHIVWSVDANNTSNSIYVNGSSLTLTLSPINYSYAMNEINQLVAIGRAGWISDRFFEGYMANIQFIDGQALDASYFGEISQDIWVPKTFDGTSSTGGSTVSADYGTNGFLLDFSSISGTTINDTAPLSGNHLTNNNWTASGF